MSDIVNLWYTWRKTMAQLEFLSDWRTSRDEHERNIWTHSGDDGARRKQLNPKIAARLIEVGTEEAKHMLAGAEPSGPASQNPTPFKPLLVHLSASRM